MLLLFQSQLESAKDVADEFDRKLVSMATTINTLEQQMNNPFSIFAEADEVKKQLEEHKVILRRPTLSYLFKPSIFFRQS